MSSTPPKHYKLKLVCLAPIEQVTSSGIDVRGAASRHFEFGVIQIKACIEVSYGILSTLLMENNWQIIHLLW